MPSKFLAERMAALWHRLAPVFGDDPVLAMYGTDHSAPVGSLVKLVAGLDESVVDVRLATLAEYVGDRDPAEQAIPVVAGELRSHAAANILPGVISVRPHLKQAWRRRSAWSNGTRNRSRRCGRRSGRSSLVDAAASDRVVAGRVDQPPPRQVQELPR